MNVTRIVAMLEEYREILRADTLSVQGEKLTKWAQSISSNEVTELLYTVRLLIEAQRNYPTATLDEVFDVASHNAKCLE